MVYSWGENIIRFACTNGSRAWPLCSAISHFPNHKITIIYTHAISLTTYVYRPMQVQLLWKPAADWPGGSIMQLVA